MMQIFIEELLINLLERSFKGIFKDNSKPSDLFRRFINSEIYQRYLVRCYLSSSRGRVNTNNFSSQTILEISNLVLLHCCRKIEEKNDINFELFLCGYPPHSVVDYAVYYLTRFKNILNK